MSLPSLLFYFNSKKNQGMGGAREQHARTPQEGVNQRRPPTGWALTEGSINSPMHRKVGARARGHPGDGDGDHHSMAELREGLRWPLKPRFGGVGADEPPLMAFSYLQGPNGGL